MLILLVTREKKMVCSVNGSWKDTDIIALPCQCYFFFFKDSEIT